VQDGADLGLAIAAHTGDVEAALAAHEQALVPRGAAAATDGTELSELMFGDGAPHSLGSAFTGEEPVVSPR
jgi:hypothetical protein